MKDKIGDMLMVDINSEEDNILRTLHYTPHIFDSGKRVIFLVDPRGLRLYKKILKHIGKGKPCNTK